MNTIKEIQRINEEELNRGLAGTPASWHAKYANSAWCYVGNLSHDLSEGDVLCIMSQWGEAEDIHLVREESTGKSRGFGFVKYEDARSCVLAVDNMGGATVLGRSIRIDHVENYRLPKNVLEKEAEMAAKNNAQHGGDNVGGAGHAYKDKELANQYKIDQGVDLFGGGNNDDNDPIPHQDTNEEDDDKKRRKEERKKKRQKKEKRHRKKDEKGERKRSRKQHSSEDSDTDGEVDGKKHKHKSKRHKKEKRIEV